MRIACVLITHLRSKVELLREPRLEAVPAVIVGRERGRALVLDTLPPAPGALIGMTVEEALSHRADATVVEADELAYHKAFSDVLASLQEVSDAVEEGELGVAYARLDGLFAMHGGEARLALALLSAVPAHLQPRAGIADGKFPAYVAARTADAMGAVRVPGDAAAFLAPHPVDLLPVAGETIAAMHRFGIHTLGDAASWRVERLVDQFGADGHLAWELARSVDRRPLIPLKHEEAITEHLALPFASASSELLAMAVERLLRRAFARPDVRGRYAGWAQLACTLAGGGGWEKVIHFKRGIGRWEDAAVVVRGQLASDHPPAPVEEMALTLGALTGGSVVQMGLLPDAQQDRQRRLVEVERQLQAKTNGRHSLHRIAEVAPWHPAPEMRALRVPIDPLAEGEMQPIAAPVAADVREGRDGEPEAVWLGRRWRRVGSIEERWSFDLWWAPVPTARAYYAIACDDGGRHTLFRDLRGGGWYEQRSSWEAP